MPFVIRYVDRNNTIEKERFIRFILCDSGLTGKALSDKIVYCLSDFGLDLKYCRGQCYDGAGNMAGKTKGAAARIMQQNSLTLYTHCASHNLNLCVASSCKVQSVKNMMENVRVISDFFNNSPKRQQLLEAMIKEHLPDIKQSTLIDVCRKRWVRRIDGLSKFCEMHFPITEALSAIRENTNG